jgi:hypothetical protein
VVGGAVVSNGDCLFVSQQKERGPRVDIAKASPADHGGAFARTETSVTHSPRRLLFIRDREGTREAEKKTLGGVGPLIPPSRGEKAE